MKNLPIGSVEGGVGSIGGVGLVGFVGFDGRVGLPGCTGGRSFDSSDSEECESLSLESEWWWGWWWGGLGLIDQCGCGSFFDNSFRSCSKLCAGKNAPDTIQKHPNSRTIVEILPIFDIFYLRFIDIKRWYSL